MIIKKVIAGIVGYIIISVIITILFAYTDRKAGEPAEKVYKDDNFNDYCLVGFLFPISLSYLIIAGIYELIILANKKIVKFIKIMCIKIIETKIEKKEKENGKERTKSNNTKKLLRESNSRSEEHTSELQSLY